MNACRAHYTRLLTLLPLLAPASGYAASATWNGTTDSLWTTPANWSASPVPGTGDTATFNNAGGASDVIDIGTGLILNSLIFDSASADAYTIGSGAVGSQTLTLNHGGGVAMNAGVGVSQLFNSALLLGTDATAQSYAFSNESLAGTLTFAGGISGGATGVAGAKTLNVAGAGNTTISGIIANGGAASVGLVKSGAGTLRLSGVNTYTGATTINTGTLIAGNAAALGANTAGTTVAAGATLDVGGQNLGTEVVTISGTGVGGNGAIVNSGVDQINALGRIVLAANSTIGGSSRWDLRNSTPTLNMAGFTLTKTGSNYLPFVAATVSNPGHIVVNQGELNLSTSTNLAGTSANTITVNNGGRLGMYQSSSAHAWTLNLNTGSTLRGENGGATQNVWAGPVNVAGEVTLLAENGHNLTISGAIAGVGNLTKTGAGNAILKGANTFTGTTTARVGTLTLDYSASNTSKLDDASALIFNAGAVSLAGGTHAEVVASTTLAAGSANSVSRASGTALIHLNTITVGAGSTLNLGAASIATTDNTNTNGILGPWATVGNDWAVNSTDGADGAITAYSTYTLSSVAGTSAGNYANNHISVDANQTLDGGITPHSLRFDTAGARTLTLQGANTLGNGAILVGTTVGNNASAITGGSLTGAPSGDFVIHQRNTANSLSIGSTIVDNGTTSLVKLGGGTAILTAGNSYSGTTTIAGGNLQINNAAAIGGTQIVTTGQNNAALVLNDGLTAGAGKTITVAGGGAGGFFGALSTTGTSTWQGNVIIGATTGTRVGTLGTTGALTISGDITEPLGTPSELNIRTNGAAVPVILSGSNSYTGGTRLLIGTLRLGSTNALGNGTGNLTISGATTLSSDGASARAIANNVVLEGNPILGDTTNNGKLTFAGGINLGATTRTLTLNSDVQLNGAFSNPAANNAVTKAGPGTLTINASNAGVNFGGGNPAGFQITAGKVIATHTAAFGNAGQIVTLNGGTGTTAGSFLEFATDTPLNAYVLNQNSSNNGTVILNRATLGTGISYSMGTATLGATSIFNVQKGGNVTDTPTLVLSGLALTAGGAGTTTLRPTTANLLITGGVSSSSNFAKTLELQGSGSANEISGIVSNGQNVVTLLKSGDSTWTLSGANTYTGPTTVRQGTLILSGARTGTSGTITVSDTAATDAILTITDGTYALGAGQMNVGNAATTAATGTVNQSGGHISFTSGNGLLIGQNSVANRGIYNLSGGSITTFASTTRGIMLGVNTGAFGGTFNLSGTGVLNMTAASGGGGDALLEIGRSDTTASGTNNLFNQTGGTANVGILTLGGSAGGSSGVTATLTLNGGTFSANQFTKLSAGNTNTSVINIGGTADVTLPAFPTARGTSSTATLHFDGGTLRPLVASATYLGGLTQATIRAGGAKFDVPTGRDITVSQDLEENGASTGGGLTKTGAGVLTLSGNSAYFGTTQVQQGTLVIKGSIPSTGLIHVSAGATLGGSGYAGEATIANAGHLAPGDAVDNILDLAALTLNSNSELDFELGAPWQGDDPFTPDFYPGVNNDHVLLTGAIMLSGKLNVSARSGGGFETHVLGSKWLLMKTDGSISGSVPTLGAMAPLNSPELAYSIQTTLDGRVLLVVVPEAGTAGLVATGLLLLLRRLRPRRRDL